MNKNMRTWVIGICVALVIIVAVAAAFASNNRNGSDTGQSSENQTESIENLRQAQGSCSELKNCELDVRLYQHRVNQILQTMFQDMSNARDTNRINCDFMWEMIPHHRGAVEMSKNALQFDICPQLKPILDAIITSQQKGIREMQHLLKCLGC